MKRSDLGTRLLICLDEKDLTQGEFAEKLGYSTAAVSAWISGKREPRISALKNMAVILGCSTDYLLGIKN